uniref:Ionotropic glutamate receptor C-terminal domain-containing protein n=1 Tax=Cucumis sativus TaxID=3659 RepID=A0A0A0LMA6_CUCSA
MRRRKGMKSGSWVLLMMLLLATATVAAKEEEEEKEKATGALKVKVGVVLDSDDYGKVDLSCISMALSDFYASRSHFKTRVVLKPMDSNGTVVDAAAAALELIKKEEVQAIIGPTSSMQANFMIDIGDKAHVPIISFSATRPSLTSHRSPFFFRVAQDDSSQVKAIGAIVKTFKWRNVVPIYVDNEFGDGIIPYLINALQEVNTHVPYQSIISPDVTDDHLTSELYKLMTMQTRVFVVHMLPDLASRIFMKAKQIGMMKKEYVWIITDSVTNMLESIKPSTFESMQGVIGLKTYVPRTEKLESFERDWRKRFLRYYPKMGDAPALDVFALWAYDAAWALAIAVEKAGTDNLKYSQTNFTTLNYLYNLGANQNGEKLRVAFSKVKFKGLAGEFSVKNGQLDSEIFEIVNVIGNGRRNVGFWSPESELRTELERGRDGLRTIIWGGGDSGVPPEGWEIPTNEKKLRVVVPKFDALVGDLTIRANRSRYIDYTLPFAESGVSMVVPIMSTKNTNAWVFIKPLTGHLWSLTGGFFLVMALVVWTLEHRVNEEFRGSPLDQGFPKGSPLVPDISRAILEVAESDRMREIENAWFKKVQECSISDASKLSSTRLSIGSFWALFVIVACVSAVSVICYIIKFLYEQKGVWLNENRLTTRERLRELGKIFMDRDAGAHPLRRRVFINGAPVHPQPLFIRDNDHPRAD